MYSLIVEKSTLDGIITVSGAKNAALPILIASLLFNKVDLRNIPVKLLDTQSICNLLQFHGSNIFMQGNCVDLDNTAIKYRDCPVEITKQTRSSLWMLAPMLTRFGKVKLPLPGGCSLNIGPRMINFHVDLLKKMGAAVEVNDSFIEANLDQNKRLKGVRFKYENISVGATITGILAACLANGTTYLENCAIEPEVVDLCNFLNKGGAKITWISNRDLEIIGVDSLSNIEYSIISDRIEALTYVLASGATGGEVVLKNMQYNLIEHLLPIFNLAGMQINIIENPKYATKNYDSGIEVDNMDVYGTEFETTDFAVLEGPNLYNNNLDTNLTSSMYDIKISRIEKQLLSTNISTSPYPGFPTDLQAPFMAAMCTANGISIIEENLFDNRLNHALELKKMGANIELQNNNIAIIKGLPKLKGAEVMGLNLRASVALCIAGFTASGKTIIKNAEHILRGYEDIEQKLLNCNAKIKLIKGNI